MIRFKAAAALFAIFCCVCSDFHGGGGSSTGNAVIAGALVDPSGSIVVHGVARLYRSDAMPQFPDTGETPAAGCDTSDVEGRYCFAGVVPGSYNLLCWDSLGKLKAFLHGVSVGPNDDRFDTVQLQTTTSLSGIVTNPKPPVTVSFVPGSPYITRVNDTSGAFRLAAIPWGPYPVIFKNLGSVGDSAGKTWSYTYTLGHLSDTTPVVTITLIEAATPGNPRYGAQFEKRTAFPRRWRK